jgi:hypothetical protein
MKRSHVAFLALATACAAVCFAPRARAVGGVDLQVGEFALKSGVFNSVFAKELCSCRFVDDQSLEDCQAHDNLPGIAHQLVNLEVDEDAKTVTSSYKGKETIAAITGIATLGLATVQLGGPASARFDQDHPEFGCVMTRVPSDP